MKGKVKIEEKGTLEIEIGGQSKSVDVYRAFNQLLDIAQRVDETHPGEDHVARRQMEYLNGVHAILNDLGYPARSDYVADQFDKAVAEMADALGKADAPAPMPV